MLSDIISTVFLASGAIIILIGSLGIIRLPDFYTRIHAVGKCDTLGLVLVLIGLGIYLGWTLITVKLFFIAIFIALANPTATHAIARAAFLFGLKPFLEVEKEESDFINKEYKSDTLP